MRYLLAVMLTLLISQSLNARTLALTGIKNSVNTEISLEVLRQAYGQLGISINYLALPGERALQTSNAGKADGEVFRIANVHKRYSNLIPVPTQINLLEGVAFVKDHSINVTDWQSLTPFSIGIQGGIKFVERGTQGMRVTIADTNEQLFKMLNANRVDVIVVAHANGLRSRAKLDMQHIASLQPAIQSYPLFHYLHKKHAGMVKKIDAVLSDMQKSGVISRIRQQVLKGFNGK